MRESRFQAQLIRELRAMFDGCVILKNDPNYLQGIPDLIVLYRDKWAALECKANESSPRQPNQVYYVDMLDDMSFAAFVSPDNKEEVLSAIQLAFGFRGKARLS
jgi:hypothetical protein